MAIPSEELDETPASAAWSGRRWLVLLALGTAAVFARALFGEFVYDDELLIARNPQVHDLRGLGALLTEPLWSAAATDSSALSFWRPLTSLVLAVGYVLGGGGPIALHVFSILAHVAATLAGFGLARRLVRAPVAFAAAALFALHPVHVESVAWITAINDPIAGLCTFASLSAWLDWRAGRRPRAALRAATWLLAGLLAKEAAAVTVPLALLLAGSWRPRELLRATWPLLGCLAVYYALRVAVFGELAAGALRGLPDHGLGIGRMAALRIELFAAYLWRLLWPAGSRLLPEVTGRTELVGFGLAVLGAAAWLMTLLLCRGRPAARFGVLAIPVALLPPLLLTGALGPYAFADRYLYVAALGFALVLAELLLRAGRAGTPVLIAITCAMAVASAAGIGRWRDRVTLFSAAVASMPSSVTARYELGRALLKRAARTGTPDDLALAREQFELARTRFRSAAAGQLLVSQTKLVDVELGLAWCDLTELQSRRGADPSGVRARFERLAREHADSVKAWTGLGVALALEGRQDEAEVALASAIALDGRDPEAHHNLGNLFLQRRRFERAHVELERALRLEPGNRATRELLVRAYVEHGLVRTAAGDVAAAEESLRRAVTLSPDSFAAVYGLGALLARSADPQRAIPWLQRALALHRRSGAEPVTYEQLAAAIAALEQ